MAKKKLSDKERLMRATKVFLWLMGYPVHGYKGFPDREDGEGLYWWRKELVKKLRAAGIEHMK